MYAVCWPLATCQLNLNLMELDNTKETNGSTPRKRENGLHLSPVSPDASGIGLPYAPVDWPEKGDLWTWKVGRRIAITGHFLDRYLYPPKHLHKPENSGKKRAFASKLSLERYVKTGFPGADINAFFASFSWKIPAKKHLFTNGQPQITVFFSFLFVPSILTAHFSYLFIDL